MKLLHHPTRCQVSLREREQGVRVVALKWRKLTWQVHNTREIWVYQGRWWQSPTLEGERRTYHILETNHGEITVYQHQQPDQALALWYVAGWFD